MRCATTTRGPPLQSRMRARADHLCERGKAYLRPLFDGDKEYKDKTEDEMDQIVQEMWRRGDGGDAARMNPWHKNLDGTMFWL